MFLRAENRNMWAAYCLMRANETISAKQNSVFSGRLLSSARKIKECAGKSRNVIGKPLDLVGKSIGSRREYPGSPRKTRKVEEILKRANAKQYPGEE